MEEGDDGMCKKIKSSWGPLDKCDKPAMHAGACRKRALVTEAGAAAALRKRSAARAKQGEVRGVGLLGQQYILFEDVERLALWPVFGHFSSDEVVNIIYKVGHHHTHRRANMPSHQASNSQLV